MDERVAASSEDSARPVGYGRIVRLAIPALGVLAAEPLYVLVDTAVIGHLGLIPLAALGASGAIMSFAAAAFNFLAYGTTGRAARLYGAGRRGDAVREGVLASWLALAIGLVFVAFVQVAVGPLLTVLVGGGPDASAVRSAAELWLRIASLGAPGILLALAGNGWMRGVQLTRRPLWFVLAGNGISVILCPLLVYPAGLGLVGSAIANVIAQAVVSVLFVVALVRERAATGVSLRPELAGIGRQLTVGRDLMVRTLAMQFCFLSAAAVAARMGAAQLGAHQIALQLWTFLALVLDSLAIAAQSLVGAALGGQRALAARGVARRVAIAGGVLGVGFGLVLFAGTSAIPRLFSSDSGVLEQAAVAWPLFALMVPLAGVLFALDGVLMGAGDLRFLRNLTLISTLGAFGPMVWIAYAADWGLGGIWVGLTLFVVVRLVGMAIRVASSRWLVLGPDRA